MFVVVVVYLNLLCFVLFLYVLIVGLAHIGAYCYHGFFDLFVSKIFVFFCVVYYSSLAFNSACLKFTIIIEKQNKYAWTKK